MKRERKAAVKRFPAALSMAPEQSHVPHHVPTTSYRSKQAHENENVYAQTLSYYSTASSTLQRGLFRTILNFCRKLRSIVRSLILVRFGGLGIGRKEDPRCLTMLETLDTFAIFQFGSGLPDNLADRRMKAGATAISVLSVIISSRESSFIFKFVEAFRIWLVLFRVSPMLSSL